MKLKSAIVYLFALLFFLAFVLIISHKVLPNTGILTYGDGAYIWPWSSYNPYSTWLPSFMGESWAGRMFGSPIVLSVLRLLVNSGISNETTAYILNYLPVLLTCMLTFFFTKKISQNSIFPFFAGLYVILNNFILEQFILFPGHYFWNVISLLTLIYLSWKIYYKGFSVKYVTLIALISLLCEHPFLLALFLIYFVLFSIFNFAIHHNLKSVVSCFLTCILILLIHSYWLIPFMLNLINQGSINTYNGGQFAVYEGFKNTANYFNIFNLANYPTQIQNTYIHNVFQTLFNFVLYAILFLLLIKNGHLLKSRFVVFLFFVFIIFFNLALGPNSLLTGGLFEWSFNNIPGLGFFRSFTRFHQMSILVLIFFMGFIVQQLKNRFTNALLMLLTLLIIPANLIFFSGDFNGLITAAKIPKEYFDINKKYFQDNTQYSILSYPNIGYESNQWSINKNIRGFPQLSYFKFLFFSKPVAFSMFAQPLGEYNTSHNDMFKFNDVFQFTASYDKKLSELNIKYILVQKDLFDITNINKQVSYEKYLQYFNSRPTQYKLRENNKYFSLYEVKEYSSLINGKNISFTKIYDSKYIIRVKNFKNKFDLEFLQNNNKDWNLFLSKPSINNDCNISREYSEHNTSECIGKSNFFEGEELSYLWKKPFLDEAKQTSIGYPNRWIFDYNYIVNKYDQSYFHYNSDGSIDLELVLFFKPQAFFYLGILITLIIFLFCLIIQITYILNIKLILKKDNK